MEIMQQQQ